jgi:hypothetical protein
MYVNDGDGTFSTHNANLTNLAFTHQHFVDYDNDGDFDFWISGQNSTGTDMVILYNNSLGNFSASSASFNALWNASAAWGDYDADGRADLIYMGLNSTSDPTTYYYQNNGVNNFTAAEWGLSGIAEGDIAWLDFDNNNKLDFFITGSSSGGNKSISVSERYH